MLRGFEKIEEEKEKLETSSLYKQCYGELISYIRASFAPIKSPMLERLLAIKGHEVRRLIRHARRNGVPIMSSVQGYAIASSPDELEQTIKQLSSRAFDLLYTVRKLKKVFKNKAQTEMMLG